VGGIVVFFSTRLEIINVVAAPDISNNQLEKPLTTGFVLSIIRQLAFANSWCVASFTRLAHASRLLFGFSGGSIDLDIQQQLIFI